MKPILKSEELEQFWLKIIKEKGLSKEEVMTRLNVGNVGILQIYIRTDNPKYIRLLCEALDVQPCKVKPYIVHHFHNNPKTKSELLEDIAYRNLYNYKELAKLIKPYGNSPVKKAKIGVVEAKILFDKFGVDIFQSTKFETYPAKRNPRTLSEKIGNYLFLHDLSISGFLKKFHIPKQCSSPQKIEDWLMLQDIKTQTKILEAVDVVDEIENLMRKPMATKEPTNFNHKNKVTLEDQLPKGKKERLAKMFAEIAQQETEQKTPVTTNPANQNQRTQIENRKETENVSNTTAYAEIAQLLIRKLNQGLLTLKVIKEDFPIVYEAYKAEFKKADNRYNDLSKILSDNKPLVFEDVELTVYEKQMIKTMLAGIVANKKTATA